jgi:outer membrane protein OmpA-like peptidoglycan-associated protein
VLRLQVYGSRSDDESEQIAASRRAAVRDYLADVWAIARSRIIDGTGNGPLQPSTQATDDGRADNRRVEFVGSDRALFSPVVTTRIIQEFDPPQLRLTPRITAEAGVRAWRIVIRQGGVELARYSSDSNAPAGDLTWSIVHDRVDSVLQPLVAELEVTDSAGGVVTTRTEAPLLLRKIGRSVDDRSELGSNGERVSFSLVAFAFDSPELGEQNESQITEIVSTVRPGARIRVVGYTDRIGNERRNRDLSLERAGRVAAELERRLVASGTTGATVTFEGAGPEVSRFENDLPEGRFLSRGVSVVVEQGEK